MSYLVLTLLLLSDLGFVYVYLVSLNPQRFTWLVELLAGEGAAPPNYIPLALLLAIVTQVIIILLIFWSITRQQTLKSKLKVVKQRSADLSKKTSEIEKNLKEQEKELTQAQSAEQKLPLMTERIKHLEELNRELKKENQALTSANEKLEGDVQRHELKAARNGGGTLLDQVKQWFKS